MCVKLKLKKIIQSDLLLIFSGVLHLESSIQGTQQARRQEIRRKQLCVARCASRVNPRTLRVRQCVSVHGSRKRSRCFDDPQWSSPRYTAHSSEFLKPSFYLYGLNILKIREKVLNFVVFFKVMLFQVSSMIFGFINSKKAYQNSG